MSTPADASFCCPGSAPCERCDQVSACALTEHHAGPCAADLCPMCWTELACATDEEVAP